MVRWSAFIFFSLLYAGLYLKNSGGISLAGPVPVEKCQSLIESNQSNNPETKYSEYTISEFSSNHQKAYTFFRNHKLHLIILPFVLLLVFLERVIPLKKAPLFRKGFFSDLGWYSIIQEQLLSVGLIEYLMQFSFTHHFGVISKQPLWLQFFIVLILFDFATYWIHRFFHFSRLWRFHELHHSSTHIDWLSGLRQHPVDIILASVANAIVFCLTGADFKVSVIIAGVVTVHGIYKHSNFKNSIGPFQYIIISSDMHRLHHLNELKYQKSNYGTLLSIWDRIFGTICYPKGNEHNDIPFGTDDKYPQNFIDGNIYVFRKMKC